MESKTHKNTKLNPSLKLKTNTLNAISIMIFIFCYCFKSKKDNKSLIQYLTELVVLQVSQ